MDNSKKAVSVIVLIFNPEMKKLKATLSSIIAQEGVDYEVILSDDGSKQFSEEEIRTFFRNKDFHSYHLVRSAENTGTIKNYLRGLKKARGEYVYGISPGDILYDKNVLRDFYKYAVTHNSKICFGKASYYNRQEDKINVFSNIMSRPRYPYLFSERYGRKWEKTALLSGNMILGPTFFRERLSTIDSLNEVKEKIKYLEDSSTAMLAELNGDRILYFDRAIIWYELGVGISTHKDSEWGAILKKEFECTYKYLKQKFPCDRELDFVLIREKERSVIKRTIVCFVRHPIVSFRFLIIKSLKKCYADQTQDAIKHLLEYLDEYFQISKVEEIEYASN